MRTRADEPREAAERSERRARFVWVGIILGLLGLAVGTQTVLLTLALGDPSMVAEPDYYQKALAWEETQQQRATNAALGWSVEVDSRSVDLTRRELRVVPRDAGGEVLEGAEVSVEAFHKARRAQPVQATLQARDGGAYSAVLPLRRPGLWELRLVVRRGERTFTATVERDLAPLTALRPQPAVAGGGG